MKLMRNLKPVNAFLLLCYIIYTIFEALNINERTVYIVTGNSYYTAFRVVLRTARFCLYTLC